MNKLYIKKDISSRDLIKEIFGNKEIIYNKYGKPYLKDNSSYFNISNKDNITVLVTSDRDVGIDIERITYREKVMNKFTKEEVSLINESQDKAKIFTEVFTKKEAYAKMLGRGLSYGIENIDTLKIKAKVVYSDNYIITIVEKE